MDDLLPLLWQRRRAFSSKQSVAKLDNKEGSLFVLFHSRHQAPELHRRMQDLCWRFIPGCVAETDQREGSGLAGAARFNLYSSPYLPEPATREVGNYREAISENQRPGSTLTKKGPDVSRPGQ